MVLKKIHYEYYLIRRIIFFYLAVGFFYLAILSITFSAVASTRRPGSHRRRCLVYVSQHGASNSARVPSNGSLS